MKKVLYLLIMLLAVFLIYRWLTHEKTAFSFKLIANKQQPPNQGLSQTLNDETIKSLEQQLEELKEQRRSLWEKQQERPSGIAKNTKLVAQIKNLQDQWGQLQDKIALRGKEIIDQLKVKNAELYKLIGDRNAREGKLWGEALLDARIERIGSGKWQGRLIHPASPSMYDEQIKEWNKRIKELSIQTDKANEAQINDEKVKDEKLNNLKRDAEKIAEQIEELFKKIPDLIDELFQKDEVFKNLEQQSKVLERQIEELSQKLSEYKKGDAQNSNIKP